jgi:hypothetical protein
VEALNMLAALGWLALLVWVCPFGVFVMRWPVEGFEHGKALSLEAARAHDVSASITASHVSSPPPRAATIADTIPPICHWYIVRARSALA